MNEVGIELLGQLKTFLKYLDADKMRHKVGKPEYHTSHYNLPIVHCSSSPVRTLDSISLDVFPLLPLQMQTMRTTTQTKTPTKGTKRLYSPMCRIKCSAPIFFSGMYFSVLSQLGRLQRQTVSSLGCSASAPPRGTLCGLRRPNIVTPKYCSKYFSKYCPKYRLNIVQNIVPTIARNIVQNILSKYPSKSRI